MFGLFNKKKTEEELFERASAYISSAYRAETEHTDIRYSMRGGYDKDRYDAASLRERIMSGLDKPKEKAKGSLSMATDASFVDKMLWYVDQKGMRDTELYKAAQIDRRLYSKIISDRSYRPAKDTCVMLCLALRLDVAEEKDMLSRAGFALSHSSKRDVLLEFCFAEKIYDVDKVNAVLFRSLLR